MNDMYETSKEGSPRKNINNSTLEFMEDHGDDCTRPEAVS